MAIDENIARVRARIAAAAARVRRRPEDITVMAVSKTVELGTPVSSTVA